ncbi:MULTISPECIES: cyclase family protein [Tenacibaculum]|uniref:Cyclase family protein n=1 Tax=Tenacibaculum mesophilum TaxID=104268 RepID=A0AAE9MMT5_9FLAO|nr:MULTISPECIES: cyclase family protein [Tenacibaculum]GFD75582.1 arylformamidase [Tenacibaculum sp. KUL113]GFD81222.1 arylformamidase [Tenacibaculum sp. KUL118]GFD94875.1 arylformamidase [Alteromonas sp. KUL154]GFE00451.1 arylformamidase [Alteromonas sp. KUL156]AZJ33595.1 cyclase family protein [Tenacibaculum mesophilum]|eukprot:TRINITY_DN1157_c0_g1_i3.p2 TRINITY_DN1157_c0_g1~~TRINITY_DN1157_c0_g1_i3.p2  ORF type:complete len:250 (-),score=46.48 TRINITY_DN1157_c0_g1_i3:1968-2717(-)
MIATIEYNSRKYKIDLSKPLDISIAIDTSKENINAWYLDDPKIFPVSDGNWIGSVQQGADVNFNNIQFNPHSHITHTECVGHITEEVYSVNKELSKFFFLAEVVTIAPEQLKNKDFVISKKQLQNVLGNKKRDAIVIRTLPNLSDKKSMRYSNTNPTYLLEEGAIYLKEKGIEHLLIDLPSVDKEKDEGKLLAHNAFWDTQGEIRMQATITEFIYVPNRIEDGTYFLNLMIAPFENDATPSKPILYKLC